MCCGLGPAMSATSVLAARHCAVVEAWPLPGHYTRPSPAQPHLGLRRTDAGGAAGGGRGGGRPPPLPPHPGPGRLPRLQHMHPSYQGNELHSGPKFGRKTILPQYQYNLPLANLLPCIKSFIHNMKPMFDAGLDVQCVVVPGSRIKSPLSDINIS